jgi:signal transduction histidine kinase
MEIAVQKTILVVDDDPYVIDVMEKYIKSQGYGVLTATSVKESMDRIQLEKPDLLLADYSLPDGTGLDVVRQAVREIPHLAVIVMTGVAIHDVKVAAEAIKLGAIEYMTKPFRLEVLGTQIRRSLEIQEEKREKLEDLRTKEAFPKHLIALLEKERHHLAMELHDEIGQTLTRMKMETELILDEFGTSNSLAERLKGLVDKLSAAIEQVRGISYGLRPSNLETLGLKPALQLLLDDLNKDGQIQIKHFFKGLDGRFDGDLELAMYRIVQEAMTNVFRHSQAENVSLNVIRGKDRISILVEDDGVGFDSKAALRDLKGVSGLGLLTMKERAEQFKGKIWIDSREGQGTCISVEIPFTQGGHHADH